MFGERLNQLDVRVGKIFKFARTRAAINVDIYNATNADTVLLLNNNFAVWQRRELGGAVLAANDLLAPGARLSLEMDRRENLPRLPDGLSLSVERRYGDTLILVVVKEA